MDFFDIHTHHYTASTSVFSIENKYPTATDFSNPFSIGIHPWYINVETLEQDVELVARTLLHQNCLALGECGLDALAATSLSLQIEVFKKQIALSETYQKPLIIHCVRAFNELLEIKKQVKPTQPWIVHGFDKNKFIAQNLIKHGIYLSFGAKICESKKLEEVLLELPLSKLFLETDASSLTITSIYNKVAAIKKITLNELQKQIKHNFTNTFLQ